MTMLTLHRRFQVAAFASVFFVSLLAIHECLGRWGGHQPSVSSNMNLWALTRDRIKSGPNSRGQVLLLGASRMQTGLDPTVLLDTLKGNEVLMLAVSGGNTSQAVLRDIATNTDFRGVLLVDENEATLAETNSEQDEFVDYYHRSFNTERRLDRSLMLLVEQRFVVLSPGCDALRLWGGLIGRRRIEKPLPTRTSCDRTQSIRFEDYDPGTLNELWNQRTADNVNAVIDPDEWLKKVVNGWSDPIRKLRNRGARVVFIRMPVPPQRWRNEKETFPLGRFWNPAMEQLEVSSIHFADHIPLCQFESPDASHIASRDKSEFTRRVCEIIKNERLLSE